MKLYQVILQDIRARQNLDVYITVVIAVIVAVLDIFQVTDQTIVTSATLAILALVSVSLLTNRHENNEIRNRLTETQQALADSVAVTMRYVEELYREAENIPFKGIIYDELKELISRAKNEILIFAAMYTEGLPHKTDEHPSRAEYLHTLEQTVISRQGSDFKYERILQLSPRRARSSLAESFGKRTTEHCRKILEIKHQLRPESKLRLSVKRLDALTMLTSFMIVDRRYVLLEVYGIDSEGDPYARGFFFFDDRKGELSERFRWHFDSLDNFAKPIGLAELETR